MQKTNFRTVKAFDLEICVDSVQSALAAEKGGAKRIELCSGLSEGGTTPSSGFMEVIRDNIGIDVHVLIRPRRGDFLYSDLEFEIMKKDIVLAKQKNVNGIVTGILKKDGHIDVLRMEELIALSSPLSITFHRAFDLTADPFRALDDLLKLRIDRLLTSGQERSALSGADTIRKLIAKAGREMVIMPGGGINSRNISELVKRTGAGEFHASATEKVDSEMSFYKEHVSMSGKAELSEYQHLTSISDEIRSILTAGGNIKGQ